MNDVRFRTPARGMTMLVALLVLAGCSRTALPANASADRLAPCTLKGTMFENQPLNKWTQLYHNTVSNVIDADLKVLSTGSCRIDQGTEPAPTGELRSLAAMLPPWKDNAQYRAALSQNDVGAVLLEYLRTYECSLLEMRNLVLPFQASGTGEQTATFTQRTGDQKGMINNELATARAAMNRTLLILGGMERLRPLSDGADCISKVSVDLRNEFGLMSEVAACMPKVHDARGSLFDLSSHPY